MAERSCVCLKNKTRFSNYCKLELTILHSTNYIIKVKTIHLCLFVVIFNLEWLADVKDSTKR